MNNLPVIDNDEASVYTYGEVNYIQHDNNNFTIQPWVQYTMGKTAREQVQDEILIKMAQAIEIDDLKKAKELAKLAKAIKEL